MKKLSSILFCFIACSTFAQENNDWFFYDDSPTIDISNAGEFTTRENTPGSVVQYFYASRIRQDKDWEKVLPLKKDRSERLKGKLEKYENWTFTQFRLIGKLEYEPNKYWVQIFFEIEINGRKDSGKDEAEVTLTDGDWVIVSVPT